MALNNLSSAYNTDARLRSISTVGDVAVGGDLRVAGSLVVETTSTVETGDKIIQEGDLVLFQAPSEQSTLEERTKERRVIFNNDNDGQLIPNPDIPDSADTAQIAFQGDPDASGVRGLIKFRCQDSTSTAASRLREAMRIRGLDVGIGTETPTTRLDVAGTARATRMLVNVPPAIVPAGQALALKATGLGDLDSGLITFDAGRTPDGLNAGFSAISFNCINTFNSGGGQFPNPNKLGWRMVVDQRTTSERFWIDSQVGSSPNAAIVRAYLLANANTGLMQLNGGLGIDNDGQASTRYVRPEADNLYSSGAAALAWKDIYSHNPLTGVSDATKKKDVETLPASRGLAFVEKLRPVQFRFIANDSGRKHYGLIAQEVEEVFSDLGDTTGADNGVVVKATSFVDDPDVPRPEEEPEDYSHPQVSREDYFLRYGELTAPMIRAIQELSARIPEQDPSVKENVADLTLGRAFVKTLKPKSYTTPGETTPRYGLVGSEVHTALGGVDTGVVASPDYSVNYAELVPILIKAINQLSAEVDLLKAQ